MSAPDAVNMDFVPAGYDVINEPRADGRRGGGLAVLYKADLNVVKVNNAVKATTFEQLTVAIGTGSTRLLLVNIYRPPDTNVNMFLAELADLLDELAGARVIFTGDLNCPGNIPDAVDDRLQTLVSCYDMEIVNKGPTHIHHDGKLRKLDVMFESSTQRRLTHVDTVIVGFTDHRLVKARLQHPSATSAVTTRYSYRNTKNIDIAEFRETLLSSTSWSSPLQSSDPDGIAVQLDADLRAALDKFAPVRTRTRRCGQRKSPWLTDDCVSAKRERRRLERRFARTRTNTDRAAYRRSCRNTSKLLRDARCSSVPTCARN